MQFPTKSPNYTIKNKTPIYQATSLKAFIYHIPLEQTPFDQTRGECEASAAKQIHFKSVPVRRKIIGRGEHRQNEQARDFQAVAPIRPLDQTLQTLEVPQLLQTQTNQKLATVNLSQELPVDGVQAAGKFEAERCMDRDQKKPQSGCLLAVADGRADRRQNVFIAAMGSSGHVKVAE